MYYGRQLVNSNDGSVRSVKLRCGKFKSAASQHLVRPVNKVYPLEVRSAKSCEDVEPCPASTTDLPEDTAKPSPAPTTDLPQGTAEPRSASTTDL